MCWAARQEEITMRALRYNFLFVIGLTLTMGLTSAFANGGIKDKKNRPKDMGTLSVRTTGVSMPCMWTDSTSA